MAQTKLSPEFEIEVDGEPYVWRLQRKPQWSNDAAEWRDAVLEFPPGPRARFGAPQLQASQIASDLVAKAIASAIAAGWEPLSRGKAVVIAVDAAGG